MPTLGGYETVQELASSGLVTVLSARRAGTSDAPEFVVKLCAPSVDVLGQQAADAAIAAFLARAKAQDQIARGMAGTPVGARFAKVHASGRDDESGGAFLVTDLGDKGSMQKLGSGRVTLEPATMSRLVAEVVEALAELDRALGRGHGDLKPSNILLTAAGAGGALADLSRARVLLTDPADSTAEAADRDRLADLRAVGALIHLLVLHTPFRGGWPLQPSPEWSALGSSGPAWLELVNKLLDPSDTAARPSIAELGGILAELRKQKKSRTPMYVALAAALLLAGGATTYVLTREAKPDTKTTLWSPATEERWKELCNAHRGWYSLFRAGLSRKPGEGITGAGGAGFMTRREAYLALDPQLAALVNLPGAGDGFDPWSIAKGSTTGVKPERDLNDLARDPGIYGRADWGVGRTEEALAAIDALRKGLREWSAPAALNTSATEFRQRGWDKAAAYLAQLGAGVDPEKSDDVVATIDGVLSAKATLARIDAAWAKVQERAAKTVGAGEPVLATFASSTAAIAGAGQTGTSGTRDDLTALAARVESLATLAARVAAFAEKDLAGTDLDAFMNSEGYVALRDAKPSEERLTAYLAQAAKFPNLDPALDPRRSVDLRKQLDELSAQAVRLTSRPLRVRLEDDLSARLTKLVPDVAALSSDQLRWNRRNQSRIESETRRLKDEIAALDTTVKGKIATRLAEIAAAAKQVREGLAAQNTVVETSEAVNATWRTWRDALLKDLSADEQYETLRDKAAALSAALTDANAKAIPAGFEPQNPASSVESQLAKAAADERERLLTAWLTGLGQTPPEPAALAASATTPAGQFRQTLAALGTLRDDLSRVEDLLAQGVIPGTPGEGATLDQTWTKATGAQITSLAGVRPALASLEARLNDVKAISTERDRASLLRVIDEAKADRPERALGAWKRLGDPAAAWPAAVADLAQAATVRDKLAASLQGVKPPRRDQLAQQIATDFKSRWSAFALSLVDPRQMEAALDARADFGVADADLPPRLAFNQLVRDLKAQTRDRTMTDDAVRPLVAAFLNKAGALSGDIASHPVAGRVRAALTPMGFVEERKEPEIDPRTLGPGRVWGVESASVEGDKLVFRRGNLRLEFVRIEAPEAPVFLSTRELSIGDAIDIAQGQAAAQLKEASPPQDPNVAIWTGPRGWIFTARGDLTAGTWYKNDPIFTPELPAYAPAFLAPGQVSRLAEPAGGEPTRDHPMQSISPVALGVLARSVGCRFPTPGEWQAAYGLIGSSIPAGANLRDQTWKTQQQHVDAMRKQVIRKDPYQWPDAGAFTLESGKPPEGERATSRPMNDGVLWFAKVDAGPGPVHHLVGNIAELTFSDWYKMETAPPTAAAIATLFDANMDALGIIGGSALSAPEFPIDRPLPVDTITAEEGYADMGARLAFSGKGTKPPKQPLAIQVQRVLTDEAYVLGK